MSADDELPTSEEVTGVKKMLPHNVARQITQTFSRTEEESFSWRSCMTRCLIVISNLAVFGLGILMIVVGFTNLSVCPHSMLPTWLLGSGCITVALFLLPLLIWYCPKNELERNVSWSRTECFLVIVVGGSLLLVLIGYCAGCYWTWVVGSVGCVSHVYSLALAVTLLPIIVIILIICYKLMPCF